MDDDVAAGQRAADRVLDRVGDRVSLPQRRVGRHGDRRLHEVAPGGWRARAARRSSISGSAAAIAARAAACGLLGVASISTLTLRRISRTAATTTSTATTSAAIESAAGVPARVNSRPISTAIVPTMSEAKCSALEASAGAAVARAARVRDDHPRHVDDQHDGEHAEDPAVGVDVVLAAVGQPRRGLGADERAGQDQEAAFAQRGEVLGLAVAVGMVAVRRPDRDAQRQERQQGGDEVGARVHGLGDQAQRAGDKAGDELERDQERRGDAPSPGPSADAGCRALPGARPAVAAASAAVDVARVALTAPDARRAAPRRGRDG